MADYTIEEVEDALNKACAIGMSTILVRIGPSYADLSPYLKAKYDELSAMQSRYCRGAYERAGKGAENEEDTRT